MRFIIEFVSSCMCPSISRQQQQMEETSSLVPLEEPPSYAVSYHQMPPAQRRLRRKRLRTSAEAVGMWRPSLSAILEDEDHQKGKVKMERRRSFGGERKSDNRGRARSYNNYDYGRASYSNVTAPAFIPAPFGF